MGMGGTDCSDGSGVNWQ